MKIAGDKKKKTKKNFCKHTTDGRSTQKMWPCATVPLSERRISAVAAYKVREACPLSADVRTPPGTTTLMQGRVPQSLTKTQTGQTQREKKICFYKYTTDDETTLELANFLLPCTFEWRKRELYGYVSDMVGQKSGNVAIHQ